MLLQMTEFLYFLWLNSICVSVLLVLVAQACPTLCNPMDRLLCPWNSPGKNTGVGGCFLLQGIFPTQGLIWRFLPWQMDSLPLRHQGSHQEQLYSDLKKKKRILKHHLSISPGKRERGNVATLWLHLLLQSVTSNRYQWKWGINPLFSLLVVSW